MLALSSLSQTNGLFVHCLLELLSHADSSLQQIKVEVTGTSGSREWPHWHTRYAACVLSSACLKLSFPIQ